MMQKVRNQALPCGHSPLPACRHTISGSLDSPHRGSFHLSLAVLVHYRSTGSIQAYEMVLADSGRITRVPPYLGTPLSQSSVSTTGLSPSMARLSRRLVYRVLVLNAVPLPRQSFLWRFGLFRFRSPLLAESLLLSFPRGTEMFHFPRFAPARLFIQRLVRRHYPPWVSPFGYLRIKAWLAAPRDFSQLPTSFFASCCLGIHRVPLVAWSFLFFPRVSPKSNSQRPGSNAMTIPFGHLARHYSTYCSCLLAHMLFSKIGLGCGADRDRTDDIQLAKLALSQLSYGPLNSGRNVTLVGLDRFELSTPRLSSVCSNQLSYRPDPDHERHQVFKEPGQLTRSLKTR